MIEELDGLTNEVCQKLKKSIADIIAHTPNSETAALRFKKAAAKVGTLRLRRSSNARWRSGRRPSVRIIPMWL
jgi:hypothetical protein